MRHWERIDNAGKTTTVESYSHDLDIEGAIEIDEVEFNAYIASLPPFSPAIDWRKEWLLADTAAKKLEVLARRLELK